MTLLPGVFAMLANSAFVVGLYFFTDAFNVT